MEKTKNIENIRRHYAFLQDGLVYFDSGASAQVADEVLAKTVEFYQKHYANVHRGVYRRSEESSDLYENAREKVRDYIGAKESAEILIGSGTTFGLNMVAMLLGGGLHPGDEICLTSFEHHANLIPWQEVAKRTGAVLKFIPLTPDFRLDMNAAKSLVSEKTKILAFPHISNVLGVTLPVKELTSLAKSFSIITVCDGAQGAPHGGVNVQDLGVDFYVFSGHKMGSLGGVGITYGRRAILETLPPFLTGGDMISSVDWHASVFAPLPNKYEAGTPPIAAMVSLGYAIDFLNTLDLPAIWSEQKIYQKRLFETLLSIPGFRLFNDANPDNAGTVTFYHQDVHPHDFAALLDSKNIAVRAGQHCAEPLTRLLQVPATIRMSPYIYNNEEDYLRAEAGILETLRFFA